MVMVVLIPQLHMKVITVDHLETFHKIKTIRTRHHKNTMGQTRHHKLPITQAHHHKISIIGIKAIVDNMFIMNG